MAGGPSKCAMSISSFFSAATAAYGRKKAEDDGLRRVIGEEMERAGL
jgi:hypothetical protein